MLASLHFSQTSLRTPCSSIKTFLRPSSHSSIPVCSRWEMGVRQRCRAEAQSGSLAAWYCSWGAGKEFCLWRFFPVFCYVCFSSFISLCNPSTRSVLLLFLLQHARCGSNAPTSREVTWFAAAPLPQLQQTPPFRGGQSCVTHWR